MALFRKRIIFFLATFILILITIWISKYLIHPELLFNLNKTANLTEVLSPNKSVIATSYQIYGGATDSNQTIVSVRINSANSSTDDDWIIFAMDDLKPVTVSWSSNHELYIQYASGPITKQLSDWKDIHISYFEK